MRTPQNHAGVFLGTTGAFLRTPYYHAGMFLGTTCTFLEHLLTMK
jgi:hypothetical protein